MRVSGWSGPRFPVGVDGGECGGPPLRSSGVLAQSAGAADVREVLPDRDVVDGGAPWSSYRRGRRRGSARPRGRRCPTRSRDPPARPRARRSRSRPGTSAIDPTATAPVGTPPSPRRALSRRHRWWVLGVMACASSMTAIDAPVVLVALPTIQRNLDASATGLQWIINAYGGQDRRVSITDLSLPGASARTWRPSAQPPRRGREQSVRNAPRPRRGHSTRISGKHALTRPDADADTRGREPVSLTPVLSLAAAGRCPAQA